MAARTLAVALLLVAGVLTGCIGGKDDTPTTLKKGNVQLNDTFTKPPDGREGNISAFSETNQTEKTGIGASVHTHDYWQGKNRLTIVDQDVAFDPSIGTDGATADFNVPQKGTAINVVPEGAGTVEVLISNPQRQACEPFVTLGGHFVCSPPAPGGDPVAAQTTFKLRYKHASAGSWIDAGDLVIGKATIIKITDAKQTDMPHSTSSLWSFEIVSPNNYDASLIVHAKVDAVRSADGSIPLWPAHPDFYADKTTRDIFTGEAATLGNSPTGAAESLTKPDNEGPVHPKKLISYGTRSVYVWANVSSITSANPALAPSTFYLWHTNATGISNITNPFDAKNHTVDKKEHFWILPVNDSDMDSPYQDLSRWGFQLKATYKTPDASPYQLSCYTGCADYVVKYSLVIKASNVVEPQEKYEVFCEDDTIC